MWVLTDESGKLYYPKPSQPFIIGRNQGDLILKSDGSISRAHAKIEVSTSPEKCVIIDTKSKYGTYLVNEASEVIQQIPDVHITRPNDRIRFGLQTSILTCTHVNFSVLMSSLTPKDKDELLGIMDEVGGKVLRDWDDNCSHLTVSSTKLTAKLSCSLAAGVPIVTINYWKSVKNARDEGNPIPDTKDFCPVLEDSMLLKNNKNSLLPNPSRKSIFKNLLFIFFRKGQLEVYTKMIKLAGGSSVFYGDKSLDKKMLVHSNSRVILYSDDNSQDEPYSVPAVATVQSLLKKNKRRMIPDSEIPLAILYSSIKSCCNPDFSYHSLFKSGREKTGLEEGETLVAETQEGDNQFEKRNRIIPESLVIPETESFGGGDSQRSRSERKRFLAGSIAKEDVEDSGSVSGRKRLKSDDGDTGESEKRPRIGRLPSETDKELSQRLFSCIKSKNIPAKQIFNDSDDDFEDVSPIKKSRNDKTILEKSCLDAAGSKFVSNDKEIGRKTDKNDAKINGEDRKSDLIDTETIKAHEKIKNDDEDIQRDSLPTMNANHPRYLAESDDEEMEIAREPIGDGIDEDGDDQEWSGNKENEISRVKFLQDILGDEDAMEKSILRPEVFSGGFIGKRFKKYHPKVPQRAPIEWEEVQ